MIEGARTNREATFYEEGKIHAVFRFGIEEDGKYLDENNFIPEPLLSVIME